MAEAKCDACGGIVNVPFAVHYSRSVQQWIETADCDTCWRHYQWYDGSRERPPVGSPGTESYQYYTGWYSDRHLEATAPVEVTGLGPVHD